MRISVVIPALNEAGNIGRLVEETYEQVPFENLGEVIVVDDGSDDDTPLEIKAMIDGGAFAGLRLMRHETRCGQSAALRTGISAALNPIIATMDGDGQNDPADIMALFDSLAAPGTKGPALVNGWRKQRKAEGSKRWASLAANKIRDTVLRDDCPDSGCGIKVYWRDVFLRLPYFSGMHRYLPALFQTYGHEVLSVSVNDRPRQAGTSKYTNLGRALIGIYDLVGVTWLRRRSLVPNVLEAYPAAASDFEPRARSVSEKL